MEMNDSRTPDRVLGHGGYYEVLHLLLPRFLRVLGSNDEGERELALDRAVEKLSHHVDASLIHRVEWLPGFIALPGHVPVSKFVGIEDGLFAMDLASGVVVEALGIPSVEERSQTQQDDGEENGIKVLDLCCCPGAKLQMIADRLSNRQDLVVGVDVSKQRIDVCRSLLHKARVRQPTLVGCDEEREQKEEKEMEEEERGGEGKKDASRNERARKLLYLCDGTIFSDEERGVLVYDSHVMEREMNARGERKRLNKSARQREKRLLLLSSSSVAQDGAREHALMHFDRVLVDAECSHSGSYRHMLFVKPVVEGGEGGQGGGGDVERKEGVPTPAEDVVETNPYSVFEARAAMKKSASASFYNEEREASLPTLQRNLLRNGFSKLKEERGILIYSTCSLEVAQNEEVIEWLLANEPLAELVQESPTTVESSASSSETTRIEHILSLDSSQLIESVSQYSNEQMRNLSRQICAHVATNRVCPAQSSRLPGTYFLSKQQGVSGLFFAKLRKKRDPEKA